MTTDREGDSIFVRDAPNLRPELLRLHARPLAPRLELLNLAARPLKTRFLPRSFPMVYRPGACELCRERAVYQGRISGLLNFLLAYFSFLWNKELHVVAGDLSGT